MIRKKIENYLLKQEGVSFQKQSESGSTYYKIGSSRIRLADHLCSTFSDPKVLEILIPVTGESFVLAIGGRIVVMKNYNKLREYIRSFCLTALCTKPITVTKIEKKAEVEVKNETNVSFEGLTEKQIVGFAKMLNDIREQNRKRKK